MKILAFVDQGEVFVRDMVRIFVEWPRFGLVLLDQLDTALEKARSTR